MRRVFSGHFSVSISTWCGQITVENIYDCFSNIWKFKTVERNDAIDLWETIVFFMQIHHLQTTDIWVRVDCTHSKFSFWIKLKCRSEYCRWYITLLSMHDTTRTFLVANLAAWRLATDDGIARSFHASNFPAKYITSALVWRHTLAQTRHILILETGNWKECCIVIEVKKVLAIPASFRQEIVIVNIF